ncbi:3108_t:CDS:2 [Acaulospora morrowiae]|uniref:3108_t:CDS:1 n=1 Tax=Acaulospora morrowiae TaxID=94023 RepID=A0A9N9BP62_9GLOM|nr:3108_t:CDS:2 [Acaulospora morrowiae]
MSSVQKIILFKKNTPVSVIEEVAKEIEAKSGKVVSSTSKTVKTITYSVDSNAIGVAAIANITSEKSEHIEEVQDDAIVTTQ